MGLARTRRVYTPMLQTSTRLDFKGHINKMKLECITTMSGLNTHVRVNIIMRYTCTRIYTNLYKCGT